MATLTNLDVERLTMGEIATVEKLSGLPIDALGDEDAPKGNLLAALAMIAKRRNGDPGFKWGDALGLTMPQVSEILGIEDDDDEDDDADDEAPAAGAVQRVHDVAGADLTVTTPAPRRRRGSAPDPT